MTFLLLDKEYEIYPKELVGGKASNLHQMIHDGLPVPQAFVISVDECFKLDFTSELHEHNSEFGLRLSSHIRYLSMMTGKQWNGDYNPLLVSVRSGAPISMPGMMETVLNIGLTRNNLDAFVEARGADRAFGLDCYRRLIQMYGVTVHGIPAEAFSSVYNSARIFYEELDEKANENLVRLYEGIFFQHVGIVFPDDPNEQLLQACNAVFRSWHSEKAKTYRDLEGIPHDMGTAVTVQEMVFGNLDRQSATGVVFTHDPNTGKLGWYGDFLVGAQGEDVVAGTHKVLHIQEILQDENLRKAGKDLQVTIGGLFHRYKSILDVEFTIESGKLYILQYRQAKCSRQATIRSLMDMARQGDISVLDGTSKMMELLPPIDRGTQDPGNLTLLGKGLGATEGIVVGQIAIGRDTAREYQEQGISYIYVAHETAPDDVEQMKGAVGILTASGGLVSHAALIARGWNKTCVLGFDRIKVLEDHFTFNGEMYKNGSLMKINGSTGEIFA